MRLNTKHYRKPDALDEYTLRKAATLHAKANSADPFAFGRVMLMMRQGYELPSDIIASASSRLDARGQSSGYRE